MDLSKLSDAELEMLEAGDLPPPEKMSDAMLEVLGSVEPAPEKKGFLEKVADTLTTKHLIERVAPWTAEKREPSLDKKVDIPMTSEERAAFKERSPTPSQVLAFALDTAAGEAIGLGAAKAAGRIGGAIDDVARTPYFKHGMRGDDLFAPGATVKALDKVGKAGRWVNDRLDDIVSPIVARTGNPTTDRLLTETAKRAGYLVPGLGKINAAADIAQATPHVAQKGARGMNFMIENLAPLAQYATPARRAAQGVLLEQASGGPLERRMQQLGQK